MLSVDLLLDRCCSVRFVSALAEVQAPLACLQSCGLRIDEVYMGVPVTCQVTLQNQTLLDTAFHWREVRRSRHTQTRFHEHAGTRKRVNIKGVHPGQMRR